MSTHIITLELLSDKREHPSSNVQVTCTESGYRFWIAEHFGDVFFRPTEVRPPEDLRERAVFYMDGRDGHVRCPAKHEVMKP